MVIALLLLIADTFGRSVGFKGLTLIGHDFPDKHTLLGYLIWNFRLLQSLHIITQNRVPMNKRADVPKSG